MDAMLSESEKEVLVILAEECAEVQFECMKMLRYGVDNARPGDNLTNRALLTREIGDVLACIQVVANAGLCMENINENSIFIYYKKIKLAKLGGKMSTLPKEWLVIK